MAKFTRHFEARGEFRQFSAERLLRFLVKLDQDVEIVVRPHRDRQTLRRCASPKRPVLGGTEHHPRSGDALALTSQLCWPTA